MDGETAPVTGDAKRRSAAAAAVGGLSATATENVAHVRTAICEALGPIGSSIDAARPKLALYAATRPITAGEVELGETAPPTSARRSKMAPAALGSAIAARLLRPEGEATQGEEAGSSEVLAAVAAQTATPAQEGGVSPAIEPDT